MTTRAIAVGCTLLVAAACTGADPASPEPASNALSTSEPSAIEPSDAAFGSADVTFTDGTRRVDLSVLVADTGDQRATGLMHRTELAADAGMLFVFDAPTGGAFWMKNTLLPLSIAFVGQDGTVRQLMDMEPCTADPCPRYQPDDEYLYAVEVNQGFFAAQDITTGWKLEIDDALGGAR